MVFEIKKFNIFLDSNILYDDPYLKSINKFLLDLSQQDKINLHISKVVIQEVLETYKGRIKKEIDQFKRSKNLLLKLSRLDFDDKKIERDVLVNELEEYYKKLEHSKIANIINIDETIFSSIIDHIVFKKPPFFNNKNELKDSLIAFSYVHYAKNNELENCIILTNNVKDFGDSDGIFHPNLFEIHPFVLIEDIKILKNHLNIDDTKIDIPQIQHSLENKIENLLYQTIFTNKQDFFFEELEYSIASKFSVFNFDNTLDIKKPIIQLNSYVVQKFEDLTYTIEDGLQVITGTTYLKTFVDIFDPNPKRIENNSRIKLYGPYEKELKLHFEVNLTTFDKIEYFDINNITSKWGPNNNLNLNPYHDDDLPF